ncbi:MAG TPA: succinate dehydrogenase cytochrome b subunit [Thermoanaerobaculia bacterium]|jgi:succinate dehydrogenase / fumarate reductase cytochrome b subunit|nr:succinate dehydrogenase cytochrome b subunit [Thermoanaerobaculia bacterium]
MSWFTDLYRSAVGKKAVMAVTGIILFGFVLGHMIGNLKLYEPGLYCPSLNAAGTCASKPLPYLDAYGVFLRNVGAPALPASGALWIVRVVLLVSVILHIWAAWQLTLMNRQARPRDYVSRPKVHTTYASRTMRWGGIIILLFVIYHLLDFTTGTLNPGFQEGAVRRNMLASFSPDHWYVALFYIVAQVALGFHLYHGLWSLFQSLGWNHPRFNRWRSGFAHAFAWIITLGNISFPLAVMTGLVR